MAKNCEIGKVVEIPLENGYFGYGLILNEPVVAFSKQVFSKPQQDFISLFDGPVFCIWVMKLALGEQGWNKVGKLEDHALFHSHQKFYKFDLISKKFSIYSGAQETSAEKSECLELECAAVWDREHVEDRLLSLSEGNECKWTTLLRADRQA
ncbi:immunity 26/phosphotriesterase HocA family protein [Vibrio clamense]|uniref:hypothetical protein n=1 Tax=Vibrio clamense TaxID=2910254 RepID=UPI003D214542